MVQLKMVKKKKKEKTFFKVMRIITLFVMGLLVAVVIALSQINLEALRGDVLAILQESTGLPVEIDGAVSWKLSLRPQIELNKVRVPNAEWAKHKDAFSAEKIDVTLDLISLFQDRPTIQNVKVYDATVCVEQNEKGEFSITPNISDVPKDNKSDNTAKPDYPFVDPGLGGLEVQNIDIDILGANYSLPGFQIRYIPRDETREYSGWIKSDTDVFPFILSFSKYNAERKVYPLRIAFATGGDALIANVALEGTSKAPIDFIIKGDIPDVAEVGRAFNLDLVPMPMMKVNISGGYDWQKLSLRNSSIKVRGNTLAFSGVIDWSKKLPSIKANFESKSINLVDLFPELYNRNWIHPNRDLNVFHDVPLFGKEFLKYDLDVRVLLDNFIVYREFDLQDLDAHIQLNAGQGRVDTTTVLAGGQVIAAADVQTDEEGSISVKVGGKGRGIVIGNLLDQLKIDNLISDLPVDFDMYVEANGSTLSEWMQTITGPVQVYSSSSGYAHSTLVANMYGTDFLTTLRHSIQDLFRSEKKYNQMKISCAVVNTKLRNGLAETQHGVAVETNAINVRLAGSLDLGDEKIQMSLTTVPVRGLKLSLTGNVVNSIEITGNLAEPTVQISGAAVAGKVASATGIGLLLAPFTGGIGLVAGAGVGLLAGDLLENWLADDNPCQTAMEKGAPKRRDDPEWLSVPAIDLANGIIDNSGSF